MLSLLEVVKARYLHVNVAKVDGQHRLLTLGVCPPVEVEGLLVVGEAARIELRAKDVAEILKADSEIMYLGALGASELVVWSGERPGCLVPGPSDEGLLEARGSGPVFRILSEPNAVVGDEKPVIFTAGTAAALGAVSWTKVPTTGDVILLRDGRV